MENSSTYRRDRDLNPSVHSQTVVNTGMAALRRISWSAVFAGVLIAIVTQLVLTLLGIGIGLGTIDPVEERNPVQGLGLGAGIWYVVTSLIALFVGGWVAGRLSSAPRSFDGMIHGILTWCLVTLITFYMLSTAVGRIIGGATSLLGNVLGAAGRGVSQVAPQLADQAQSQLQAQGIDVSNLRNEVEELLRDTGKPGLQPENLQKQANQAQAKAGNAAEKAASNPQAADETGGSVFNQIFKQGQGIAGQIDREAAVNLIVNRTGKSRAEAEQIADRWVNTYNQARGQVSKAASQAEIQARHTADNSADSASTASILASLGLLLGAAVAGFGAKKGTDSKDDYNRYDKPVDPVSR